MINFEDVKVLGCDFVRGHLPRASIPLSRSDELVRALLRTDEPYRIACTISCLCWE